ncbi:ABC transporter permease [Pasteuria penetrans]|uniref:ABC transporter permease n=1 Tax=Pasteuria penetrans TaxID=86005 RepID=UPI000FB30E5E|nr:ABC transporter permease [Pasteuria penetrans]
MTFLSCVIHMIQRRPQAYISLLLNSIIISSVLFAFSSFIFHPQLEIFRFFSEFSLLVFWVMFYILMFCSFFSIFYSMATLYRGRQRQFGIFLLLGMRPQQLRVLLSIETMIVGGFSIVFGVLFGVVLNLGLVSFIRSFLEYVPLGFHFSFGSLGITTASSLAIFLLAALVMPFFVRSQKVVQLLQGEKRVDDRPEPLVGLFRVLASFFSLGIVVAICLFSPVDAGFNEFPNSIQYIFPICVILTFVGVYFFYCQGSVALAKWFRWNRSFSWRGMRLLWIGNMAYRLRDNSRFLWFFSMLLLTVFTSVSVVVAVVRVWIPYSTVGGGKQQQNLASLLIHRHLVEEGRIGSEAQRRSWRMDQILLHSDSGLKRVDSTPIVRLDKKNTGLIKPPVKPEEHEKYKEIQDKKRGALARGDRSFLEEHTEFIAISVNDYNRIMEAYGGKLLSLTPNEAAALGSRQEKNLNPLPWGLGTARITVPDLDQQPSVLFPPLGYGTHGEMGVYVLGEGVYSKLLASRDPSIRKFWDAHYVSRQGEMNSRIFKALGQAGLLYPNDKYPPEKIRGSSIVYNGMNKHSDEWIVFFSLSAVLILSLVFVIIAGNFLLLRIYTDVEEQRQQFHNLLRIGFSVRHLQKSITVQMSCVFFFPLLLAVLLTSCALYYGVRFARHSFPVGKGKEMGDEILSVALFPSLQVIVVFLGVQAIMFFLARLWVLRAMGERRTG